MSDGRIYVAVACHNRKSVAELCLPTLVESVTFMDKLVLHNDGSSEYDASWLRQFTAPTANHHVIDHPKPIGIQAQRRLHLTDFLESKEYFTHLNLTDHDCIHDPSWAPNALTLQAKYDGAPLCLYNTEAHVRLPGNTIRDEPESKVIWRRVAPGVSYLLTRKHVEQLAPHIGRLEHFDWQIPQLIGPFAVSRVGYIDHIGWGGERHPISEGPDGGDRVLSPTPWLQAKRAEIVARLTK